MSAAATAPSWPRPPRAPRPPPDAVRSAGGRRAGRAPLRPAGLAERATVARRRFPDRSAARRAPTSSRWSGSSTITTTMRRSAILRAARALPDQTARCCWPNRWPTRPAPSRSAMPISAFTSLAMGSGRPRSVDRARRHAPRRRASAGSRAVPTRTPMLTGLLVARCRG